MLLLQVVIIELCCQKLSIRKISSAYILQQHNVFTSGPNVKTFYDHNLLRCEIG